MPEAPCGCATASPAPMASRRACRRAGCCALHRPAMARSGPPAPVAWPAMSRGAGKRSGRTGPTRRRRPTMCSSTVAARSGSRHRTPCGSCRPASAGSAAAVPWSRAMRCWPKIRRGGSGCLTPSWARAHWGLWRSSAASQARGPSRWCRPSSCCSPATAVCGSLMCAAACCGCRRRSALRAARPWWRPICRSASRASRACRPMWPCPWSRMPRVRSGSAPTTASAASGSGGCARCRSWRSSPITASPSWPMATACWPPTGTSRSTWPRPRRRSCERAGRRCGPARPRPTAPCGRSTAKASGAPAPTGAAASSWGSPPPPVCWRWRPMPAAAPGWPSTKPASSTPAVPARAASAPWSAAARCRPRSPPAPMAASGSATTTNCCAWPTAA